MAASEFVTPDAAPGVFKEQSSRRDVIPFARAVFEIARKEVLMFVRTKRLYVMGGLYALGFVVLTVVLGYALQDFLGQEFDFFFGGTSGFQLSKANLVMALALFLPIVGAVTFLNLVGIVFTFDAVVREYEDRSLFLILSKPVTREAFVIGKFAGAIFMVGALFFSVGTVVYFLAMMFVGEFPSPSDAVRYFLSLGMVFLGLMALSSLGLFSSAVTKSTVMSILFSLSMWLIVLQILAQAGTIYAALTRQIAEGPWYIQATKYLNPSSSAGPAFQIMVNWSGLEAATGQNLNIPFLVTGLDLDPFISALSLLAFTAVFVGATLWVVGRRNFE